MKSLILQGFGISIKVVNGVIQITNGRSLFNGSDSSSNQREIITVSSKPNFDKIIIEGVSGWISFEALKILSDYNVNVIMVDNKGRLFANYTQFGTSAEPLLRKKQYDLFISNANDNDVKNNDIKNDTRLEYLRKWIVSQKIESQLQLFRELIIKLNDVNNRTLIQSSIVNMQKHYNNLVNAHSLREIRVIESSVSIWYYPKFAKLFNPVFGFKNRGGMLRIEKDAIDVINTLLNYGFSILHAEVAKQLNSIGLDCQVGFYHVSHKINMALVYDMMEPFRYLVDRTVFEIKDSITDKDYHYRSFENKYPYNKFNLPSRWLYVSKELKKRFVKLLVLEFERKRLYKPRKGITIADSENVEMEQINVMKTKCMELRDYILASNKEIINHLPNTT